MSTYKLILSNNLSNATVGPRNVKCTTVLHIEKKLRLWSRDLDLTTVQHFWLLLLNLASDLG